MGIGVESSLRISRQCCDKHCSKEFLVSKYCISTEHTCRSEIAEPYICECSILIDNVKQLSEVVVPIFYSCW